LAQATVSGGERAAALRWAEFCGVAGEAQWKRIPVSRSQLRCQARGTAKTGVARLWLDNERVRGPDRGHVQLVFRDPWPTESGPRFQQEGWPAWIRSHLLLLDQFIDDGSARRKCDG